MQFHRQRFFNGLRSIAAVALMSSFVVAGLVRSSYSHGGEDHGDAPAQTVTTAKGVSRSGRLGELEVTVKHPVLEPDKAAAGSLFITKFETNEAVAEAEAAIELESSTGTVTKVTVNKTERPGAFQILLPAVTEGTYTMRVNVTTKGETDTLTLAGVNITRAESETTSVGMSWLRTGLLATVGAIVLVLFAGLFVIVWRSAGVQDGNQRPLSV